MTSDIPELDATIGIDSSVTIALDDVRAYGKHGVLAHEQQYAQPFDLTLRAVVDAGAAFASDAVGDTLDYARLHGRLVRLVAEKHFALLEALGHEIVRDVLRDTRVRSVRVTIAKPKLLSGATPSVTVEGSRR